MPVSGLGLASGTQVGFQPQTTGVVGASVKGQHAPAYVAALQGLVLDLNIRIEQSAKQAVNECLRTEVNAGKLRLKHYTGQRTEL